MITSRLENRSSFPVKSFLSFSASLNVITFFSQRILVNQYTEMEVSDGGVRGNW